MDLLPVDMLEGVPEVDIVHLVLVVVAGMDLAKFASHDDVSGTGKSPFDPAMMRAVLVYANAHGYRSSRKIESPSTRDAGFRMIEGESVPDHTTIARFRRRRKADMQGGLFTHILKLCREAGLARPGVVIPSWTGPKDDRPGVRHHIVNPMNMYTSKTWGIELPHTPSFFYKFIKLLN